MNEQLCKRTAEVDRQVGASVRSARIEAGLSQSRLAAHLGITFQQLQKYEKGRNRIAVGTLLLIAEALSTPVYRFFEAIGATAALDRGVSESQVQENARLIDAFDRVGDPEMRRRILTLVLAVVDGKDRPFALADAVLAEPLGAP